MYFEVWIMKVQELLTELKNLRWLPRNDSSKLTTTRTFLAICMGKHPKNRFSEIRYRFFSALGTLMYTIYVLGQDISTVYKILEGILILLTFWNFSNIYVAIFLANFKKMAKIIGKKNW